MLIRCALFPLTASLVLSVLGCSGDEEPYRKPTVRVVGQIFVDGKPVPKTKPMKVEAHPVNGMDQEHPSVSYGMTGEDGKFAISTYEQGDGLPPGDYTLTFLWGKLDLISTQYGGPDQLKGRYSDPETSEFVVSVVEGLPETDIGKIELTTE